MCATSKEQLVKRRRGCFENGQKYNMGENPQKKASVKKAYERKVSAGNHDLKKEIPERKKVRTIF